MSFTLCLNAWRRTSCSGELHCKMSCRQATCKEAYTYIKNWTWKEEIEISLHETKRREINVKE